MIRPLVVLAVGLALAACESAGTGVVVKARVPDDLGLEAPAADLALVALPYDRDSVIAAMEARAEARPSTAAVDSAFAAFRVPFSAFSSASYAAERLKDSLRSATPANSARLAAKLAAARAEVEAARPALDAARAALAAVEADRAAIRAWQDRAWAGYDTTVKPLTRFRDPVADTTDADGLGRFAIRQDRWWITATAWDASDPNAEWYWNVPVTGDTVVLSRANARRRPRY